MGNEKSVLGKKNSNVPRQGNVRKHCLFGKLPVIQQTYETGWKAGPKGSHGERRAGKVNSQIIRTPLAMLKKSGFYLGNKREASKGFSILFTKLFSDLSDKGWKMNLKQRRK